MNSKRIVAATRIAATLSLTVVAYTARAQTGYRYNQVDTATSSSSSNNYGPVRMGRISYKQGNVEWRPSENVDWSAATWNLPIRQGAQVWVNSGGKAEIQFDDGSRLRLGNGTIATLQTLYSDHSGEFTEIKLNTGLASLTLVNKNSVYQIDSPLTSIKAQGPCKLRVGVGNDVEVSVRKGKAQIEGTQGSAPLRFGQYARISNSTAPYQVEDLPRNDNWDNFNENRDQIYDHPSQYVPENIGLVAGDLNGYGDWRADRSYGHVWYPKVHRADWRPYHDGRWVWVDPFGWTWVADEPWGWTPSHYGSWIHNSNGWGWAPGPRHQYWSPAVVHFSTYNDNVAWVPLSPAEIRYPPALSVGFTSGNWAFSFSIGGAASYYPGSGSYCVGRPWNNDYVNRQANYYVPDRNINIYNNNTYITNNNYVPAYASSPYAITRTSRSGFVGTARYAAGNASDPGIFRRGRGFAVPQGQSPVFGPAAVRPNRSSFSATRSFSSQRPSQALMQRQLIRSRMPEAISRVSLAGGRFHAPRSGQAAPISISRRGNPSASSFGRTNAEAARNKVHLPLPNSNHGRGDGSFGATGRVRGNPGLGQRVPPANTRQVGHQGMRGIAPPRGKTPPIHLGQSNRPSFPTRHVSPPTHRGGAMGRQPSTVAPNKAQMRGWGGQKNRNTEVRRAMPGAGRVTPINRAPNHRTPPAVKQSRPERRNPPAVRQSRPERRNPPAMRQSPPERRAPPAVKQSRPERRNPPAMRQSPPERRTPPAKRQSPPQGRRMPPPQQRGGPPKDNKGHGKGHGGG